MCIEYASKLSARMSDPDFDHPDFVVRAAVWFTLICMTKNLRCRIDCRVMN